MKCGSGDCFLHTIPQCQCAGPDPGNRFTKALQEFAWLKDQRKECEALKEQLDQMSRSDKTDKKKEETIRELNSALEQLQQTIDTQETYREKLREEFEKDRELMERWFRQVQPSPVIAVGCGGVCRGVEGCAGGGRVWTGLEGPGWRGWGGGRWRVAGVAGCGKVSAPSTSLHASSYLGTTLHWAAGVQGWMCRAVEGSGGCWLYQGV